MRNKKSVVPGFFVTNDRYFFLGAGAEVATVLTPFSLITANRYGAEFAGSGASGDSASDPGGALSTMMHVVRPVPAPRNGSASK